VAEELGEKVLEKKVEEKKVEEERLEEENRMRFIYFQIFRNIYIYI
jgi:hypothetical protein